ncbi:MAG: DNA alkylation repair protein [Bacteroidales bacterium]|nr:DNA alkylation repair protein [Bacteroidales bacterium]
MTISEQIRQEILSCRDAQFASFQSRLLPTIDSQRVVGVRTPALRRMAKNWAKNASIDEFLSDLPHKFFEENNLHAFIISLTKDYNKCIAQLESFLPYVDNWATCDQMKPVCFKSNRNDLINKILSWIKSDKTYTVRFGIVALMTHYLDDCFRPEYLDVVANVRSSEYYIQMAVAWFFATALSAQYEKTFPYIANRKLDATVLKMTVQKARESFRISEEQKAELKQLIK